MGNQVLEAIACERPSLSVEFFPPPDAAGQEVLRRHVQALDAVGPDFVSVTYGAGGSVGRRRDQSVALTRWLAAGGAHGAMAHLTCVGHTAVELAEIAEDLREAGAQAILALRGDSPGGPGAPWEPTPAGLDHALDLVRMLRPSWDAVGVACFPYGHPASTSLACDTAVLRAKQEAGADFAVTQMIFEAEAYLRLLDRVRAGGVEIPILPGLMPVTSGRQVGKLEEFSGASLPRRLVALLDGAGGDGEQVRRIGIEWTAEVAARLVEAGAPGIHLYTLNRSTSTLEVCRMVGLGSNVVHRPREPKG
jgi:methylenetetrahydrofolate reductase (NADPH)